MGRLNVRVREAPRVRPATGMVHCDYRRRVEPRPVCVFASRIDRRAYRGLVLVCRVTDKLREYVQNGASLCIVECSGSGIREVSGEFGTCKWSEIDIGQPCG
jgi:hypothetical protein